MELPNFFKRQTPRRSHTGQGGLHCSFHPQLQGGTLVCKTLVSPFTQPWVPFRAQTPYTDFLTCCNRAGLTHRTFLRRGFILHAWASATFEAPSNIGFSIHLRLSNFTFWGNPVLLLIEPAATVLFPPFQGRSGGHRAHFCAFYQVPFSLGFRGSEYFGRYTFFPHRSWGSAVDLPFFIGGPR